MASLFDKIMMYVDYNNSYTMKKAMSTLNREFELAVSRKNQRYAEEVIITIKRIYDDFTSSYHESEDYKNTMSFSQKLFAKKMRAFLSYLIKNMNSKFGDYKNYQKEIKQIIDM